MQPDAPLVIKTIMQQWITENVRHDGTGEGSRQSEKLQVPNNPYTCSIQPYMLPEVEHFLMDHWDTKDTGKKD